MRALVIFFSIFALISCKTKNLIVVTELNTVGKVIKVETCKKCLDGGFIYTIELDPEEGQSMKFISDSPYKIGDMIYFQTLIKKETYE